MKPQPPQAPAGLLQSIKRTPGIEQLYHVAYYHAARVGYQDIVSRSLHDFKDGCEPQTARWIALAAPRVCKELKFDVIVRVLGTAELKAGPDTPLDRLCEAIAGGSGASYAPERLTKEKAVRAMTSLGGRAARQKELDGVYRFDAAGLSPRASLLLVDDIATTGSTLEAVRRAILSSLPEAEVTCFVLARVEAQLQNSHINPEYFLKGAQAEVAGTSVRMTAQGQTRVRMAAPVHNSVRIAAPVHNSVRMAAPALAEASQFHTTSVRMQSPAGPESQHVRKGTGSFDAFAAQPKGGANNQTGKVGKGLHTRFYVIGLLLSLLLLGATVLIPVKKETGTPTSQFVQLVNQSAIKSPEPIPERRSSDALPQMTGKSAVVTVPSTGLRASHSMAARIIPKATVRQKERVEILRRFTSQAGPDWILLKTKSGTIGWVVASVVKELRG